MSDVWMALRSQLAVHRLREADVAVLGDGRLQPRERLAVKQRQRAQARRPPRRRRSP
jgi:hypothetical protein